jgi:hypothetical protein
MCSGDAHMSSLFWVLCTSCLSYPGRQSPSSAAHSRTVAPGNSKLTIIFRTNWPGDAAYDPPLRHSILEHYVPSDMDTYVELQLFVLNTADIYILHTWRNKCKNAESTEKAQSVIHTDPNKGHCHSSVALSYQIPYWTCCTITFL